MALVLVESYHILLLLQSASVHQVRSDRHGIVHARIATAILLATVDALVSSFAPVLRLDFMYPLLRSV